LHPNAANAIDSSKIRLETIRVSGQIMNENESHSLGILLGWRHQSFDGKLVVQLQTRPPSATTQDEAYHTNDILMTPSQALVLAEYLTKIANGRWPVHKRSLWKRMLGTD
jgi:hypothetical protein